MRGHVYSFLYIYIYICFTPRICYFHCKFLCVKYRKKYNVNSYKDKIEVHSTETDHNLRTNSLLMYMGSWRCSKADFMCLCAGLEFMSNKPFTATLLSTENADRNAIGSKTISISQNNLHLFIFSSSHTEGTSCCNKMDLYYATPTCLYGQVNIFLLGCNSSPL